jgi:hypothetical protein
MGNNITPKIAKCLFEHPVGSNAHATTIEKVDVEKIQTREY